MYVKQFIKQYKNEQPRISKIIARIPLPALRATFPPGEGSAPTAQSS